MYYFQDYKKNKDITQYDYNFVEYTKITIADILMERNTYLFFL